MKIRDYIKDSIITGIVVIVPVVVIGVLLTDIIKKLFMLTKPLTDIMTFGGLLSETIVATIVMAVILGAFFFITGSLLKTYAGKQFSDWLEKTLLERIPFFKTISGVTRQITGVDKGQYAIVEVDIYGNNNRVLGLLTETLSDGRCVVFIPFAPVVNIGQVHIVTKENIEYLDIPIRDATDIISRIGFQADQVYKKKSEQS
jgi:uncharacterized membrane protein